MNQHLFLETPQQYAPLAMLELQAFFAREAEQLKSSRCVDYFQPDFYRFSEDSIILAKQAALLLSKVAGPVQLLDLCAGCGVVGIETILKSKRDDIELTAVELQPSFSECFNKNVELFIPAMKSSVTHIQSSYEGLQLSRKFDLIVSNPPYFDEAKNRLGPCDQKNRCRFFVEGSFNHFIETILSSLSVRGAGLFLLRDSESFHNQLQLFSERAKFKKEWGDGKTSLFVVSLLDVDRN